MKQTLLAVIISLLSGCANQGARVQAPPPNPGLQCYAELGGNATLAPLASKLVLTGADGTTLPMQADTTKPNAGEREVLAQWAALRALCWQQSKQWMRDFQMPAWYVSISTDITDTSDALIAALYRRELTFGEFNVKRLAASADGRRRFSEARDLYTREQDAARQQDAQVRFNCEQDAARMYPPVMVQRMTSPGYQPLPSQSTQTNCTSIGNQINCTSQPSGVDTSIYKQQPTYVTEDSNAISRNSAFQSCLSAKGYRRQ